MSENSGLSFWGIEIESRSEEETREWGERLSKSLRAGDLVLITGDLGTGKTRLVQGIARGLGIVERVTSPTFALIREYRGRLPLYHVDLYRLDQADLARIGLDEYLAADGITCIEWGEKAVGMTGMPGIPDGGMLLVEMEWLGEEVRLLRLQARGKSWADRRPEWSGSP